MEGNILAQSWRSIEESIQTYMSRGSIGRPHLGGFVSMLSRSSYGSLEKIPTLHCKPWSSDVSCLAFFLHLWSFSNNRTVCCGMDPNFRSRSVPVSVPITAKGHWEEGQYFLLSLLRSSQQSCRANHLPYLEGVENGPCGFWAIV